jgi:hypothetical protein
MPDENDDMIQYINPSESYDIPEQPPENHTWTSNPVPFLGYIGQNRLDVNPEMVLFTCESCGQISSQNRNNVLAFICNNCRLVTCVECERKYKKSQTITSQDGDIYCNGCYNSIFVICYHCNEEILTENRSVFQSNNYCQDCHDNLFDVCSECDREFFQEDLFWNEETDRNYCSSCRPQEEENYIPQTTSSGIIESYSYKPRVVFFSIGKNGQIYSSSLMKELVYYGVELEFECDEQNSRKFYASKINSEFIYCKSDGSLKYGIEAVSHPATFDYWMKRDPYKNVFNLAKLGCRSHDTTTCGLHVHISRTAFTNEEHLKRFMKIFYRNPSRIMRFSRREKNKLHEWASVDGVDDNAIDYKAKHGDDPNRRTAVNTQNSNTIEVRIFKGTLNKVTFYKTIEFCDAILEFTRTSNWEQTLWQGLQDYIVEHKDRYIYLNIVRNKK